MKKAVWKRRAFAFLVAAAMVIPQGVYAAEPEGNETPEKVHAEGCTLASDHDGDCVVAPAENAEETQPEKVHEDGCVLASDHEEECEVEEKTEEMAMLKAPQDARDGETRHNIGNNNVKLDNNSCGEKCPGHIITGTSNSIFNSHNIVVDGGKHTLVLDNVTIKTPGSSRSALDIKNGADVTLELRGNSSLEGGGVGSHPAIWVEAGSKLTITGDGSLQARAKGGTGAAGIGAGDNQDFGDIVIESGSVAAFGSGGGAGIGGGYKAGSGSVSGTVTITGGWVKAFGGHVDILGITSDGAGIGAGENSDFNGTITINGGVVYAQSGRDNMASIGGGGSMIGEKNHGTFKTDYNGKKGNAVIVAPNGIGANQNAADWDGIFASFGSGENTATMEPDGTVVLNDDNANIQVWGDPELDYNLIIEPETELKIHKDTENVNPAVSLTVKKDHTLTNNGTIILGVDNNDTSSLILEDGIEAAKGNGNGERKESAAVKVPITENLLKGDFSNITYNGKSHSPVISLVFHKWNLNQEYTPEGDYNRVDKDNINAGTAKIILTAKEGGNLLESTSPYEKMYTIEPADYTITVAETWSVKQGEDQLLAKLPKQTISINDPSITNSETLKNGTLSWYTDEDCTQPVGDDTVSTLKIGDKKLLYWKYTHNDSNFIFPKTGKTVVTITEFVPPNVTIPEVSEGILTKVYGSPEEKLTVKIQCNGGAWEAPKIPATWSSDDKTVVSVKQDGIVTIVTFSGVGTTKLIAHVEAYTDPSGTNSYGEANGEVTVTVTPKLILVNDTDLKLNGASKDEDGYFVLDFKDLNNIRIEGVTLANGSIVSGDEGKVELEASANLISSSDTTGKVTITYSLTGDRAKHYQLSPSTKVVDVKIINRPVTTYDVTYYPNGADAHVIQDVYSKGIVTLRGENTFTRNGYTLTGWNTQSDGSGVSYALGQKMSLNSNLALYAQWKSDGSSGGDGGSSSSGGGSHTSNTYWVRYHNDDDTEKDGKFIPGEEVAVKGNVFVAPVGKVLAGWSLEEDGKVDYKVGDTFRMPGSSVDLYAVWKDAETESHSAYISGYPDGTVGPDKTITRAEAATMFYNLLADKNGDAKAFTDVPANQWYAKAVMTLAGKGVISGYPDGTFKPNAPITRAEFVTMAMNFANADKGTVCSFPDVPQNMWYYGAIAGATQNGWISGYPDGTFGPDRYITRAEVTSVINRMENRAADMSFMMDHLDELRTFSDLGFGHWAYAPMMEAANGHDYTRADQNSYESWVDIH